MIILEVNIRKKVTGVFFNVFHSRPVPDYRISTFVFLVPKVHFSQSQTSNFQNFLGKHENSCPSSNENFGGLNSSTPLLIPFRRP